MILLEGTPFSIEIPCSVYMVGRVTLGGGLPYLLARVTLPAGTTFGHVNARGKATLPGGLSLALPGYYFKSGALINQENMIFGEIRLACKGGLSFDPSSRVTLLSGKQGLSVGKFNNRYSLVVTHPSNNRNGPGLTTVNTESIDRVAFS